MAETETFPADYEASTPLLRQYFGAAREHPGTLLLMRVGDFYEAYGRPAEILASSLNIVLTGREDGGVRVPMAGVPHHAAERYIARLIRQGMRVAVMEQVEDPKLAKGLVRREVTRVVSRGTVLEESLLDERTNNYLAALSIEKERAGVALLDISTGEFLAAEFEGEDSPLAACRELLRASPAEIIVRAGGEASLPALPETRKLKMHPFDPRDSAALRNPRQELLSHFGTASLRGFGCEEMTAGLSAAALCLQYVRETQLSALGHVTSLGVWSPDGRMILDPATRRNLELFAPLGAGGREQTLLGTLDETLTPMGARLLRRRLDEPLLDVVEIGRRLDAVGELASSELRRGDVREALRPVQDIERLVSRAVAGLASPRDLVGLRLSLERLPQLGEALRGAVSERLAELSRGLAPAGSENVAACIADLLRKALVEDPPALRDGGVFRDAYCPELQAVREAARESRNWIAALEESERERTGIASLKVGYNAVFGYYLDVTRANLAKVPANYLRKQTTASGERYITPELKEYEARVLGAEERALAREQELFAELRARVSAAAPALLLAARSVAEADVLAGLATAAVRNRYARPEVNEGPVIDIRGGRHPVVERLLGAGRFVPNDCRLDPEGARVHILTGPNMSGKSTALRQAALIVLLAQTGSFVPADSATVGVVDRIFTRIGAHDELASGQSTFLVEMHETANILNNATERSLVLLDEVGRGTSTYDGLSIAWAVLERLVETGCKTLFATHYHHLNELAKRYAGVANFRVAVREREDEIVWLHRVVPGGTDRSYGIQVAKLAGIPPAVVERAREILRGLERRSPRAEEGKEFEAAVTKRQLQLSLFEGSEHPVVEALRSLDVSALSPVEALVKLDELSRRAKETS